jgi:hypothetical protein
MSPTSSRPDVKARKPRKPTTLDDAIRQVKEAEAQKTVVIPPLDSDATLELEAQQVTQRMNHCHMEAAEIYWRVVREKLWERRGYADGPQYFEERVGIQYRTAQRAVAIWEAHLALPEGEERIAAKQALESIGVHRAAIIAPVIKEQPLEWQKWTETARTHSQEALQEQVTRARGIPSKSSPHSDDRMYHAFLNQVPPDAREEFEEIFRAGSALSETKDFVVVTILAYKDAKMNWLAAHDRMKRGGGNA